MTKQEIRDEFKEVEGNPHTKGRIRRLQRELGQPDDERCRSDRGHCEPHPLRGCDPYDLDSMGAPKVVARGATPGLANPPESH